MDIQSTPSGPPGPSLSPTNAADEWRFRGLLLIASVGVLYLLLWQGLKVFEAVSANLPLLLPLAVTVLSIFTRATEIKNAESVLKMSNDISIGIISFDIWAISASRSDPNGRIMVNPDTMISGNLVLPFLLAGLLIAVGCVVLTNYNFRSPRAKNRWLLGGFIASVLVYVAPFGVKQRATTLIPGSGMLGVRRYTVGIPYQDPDLINFAPTFLRNRKFIRVEEDVLATNDSSAAASALQRFMSSPEAIQVKTKVGAKVLVRPEELLVVER